MKRNSLCLLVVCFSLAVMISPPQLWAAPYYEGKRITIYVGMAPGGGYDRVARLLAKHLPKYIPGKPTIIIENLDGASSIIATNHVFNIAKPDGLSIGTFNRGLPFAQLTKVEGVKFDLMKFSWIGSAAVEATVLTIRSDLPFKNIEDIKKAKHPIHLSGSGPGVTDTQFAILLNEFMKLNLKVIVYPSSAEQMMAIERKEVDGRAGSYSTLKPFIERGLVRPILRGQVSDEGIEDLPVAENLVTDTTGKTILGMMSSVDRIGRPFVAPPKTPPEIMNLLRDAFGKAAMDPELREEAKKLKIDIRYVPADDCMKSLNYVFKQPENIVKEFGKYIKF